MFQSMRIRFGMSASWFKISSTSFPLPASRNSKPNGAMNLMTIFRVSIESSATITFIAPPDRLNGSPVSDVVAADPVLKSKIHAKIYVALKNTMMLSSGRCVECFRLQFRRDGASEFYAKLSEFWRVMNGLLIRRFCFKQYI